MGKRGWARSLQDAALKNHELLTTGGLSPTLPPDTWCLLENECSEQVKREDWWLF